MHMNIHNRKTNLTFNCVVFYNVCTANRFLLTEINFIDFNYYRPDIYGL